MSTLSFKEYLVEAEKVIYFTFGDMNPPTIGHEKLLDSLQEKARGNTYRVYLSQSLNENTDPLCYDDKVKYARKFFPRHARQVMLDKEVKGVHDVLVKAYNEGFKKAVMVVGEERVHEYSVLTNKFNGKEGRHGFYCFESIDILSVENPDGKRQTQSIKESVKNNDFLSFQHKVPSRVTTELARSLFNDVRKGMGLNEETDFKARVQFEPISEAREQYVRGELFNEGDTIVIKESEEVGIVSKLGANYVLVDMGEGRTLRKWLTDVEKVDA